MKCQNLQYGVITLINFIIGLVFGCWLGIFFFAIINNSNEKEGEPDGEKAKCSDVDKRR